MTNFTRKSFSVGMGNSKISEENWERTFGKKPRPDEWHLCRHDILKSDCKECNAPRVKDSVPVSSVWLRTRDQTDQEREHDRHVGLGKVKWSVIEVLVEVDGEYRLVQSHIVPNIDGTISECTWTAGIRKAPKDLL